MTADNDDPDNDPLLRSMRSVWLGMRDEEPPERGLAELMAAARAQADVMRPAKESWWRRSFALLVRPPVLAAATVLVVIGGAIALNRHGVEQAATPAVETGLRAQGPAARQDAPSFTAKDSKAEEAAATGSASARDDLAPIAKPAITTPPINRPSPVIKTKIVDGSVANEITVPPPPPPPPPADSPRGGGEGLVIAGDAPTKESTKAEKKPVEATRQRPEPVKADAAEGDSAPTTADRAPGRGPAPGVATEQLIKQAQVAASRNDCPAVRATAERVKKTDPAAYKSRLTTQPAIARCLK